MLKIKIKKVGRGKSQTLRLIVQTDREKLNGSVVETLGFVTGTKKDAVKIDQSRLKYWLEKGAIPTPSVAKILKIEKK